MKKIICIDRDGTINEDENYYLGSQDNWKELVKIKDGVIEGMKSLNSIEDSHLFIITNQAGVALVGKEFEKLNEERMHEVNQFILSKLIEGGVKIMNYYACPYVDNHYAKKALEKGRKIDTDYIREGHEDIKPGIGMIKKCVKEINEEIENCLIFFIGDRASDVEVGLNAKGIGIIIASKKTVELGDIEKVEKMKKNNYERVFFANNFLEAAQIISDKIKNLKEVK